MKKFKDALVSLGTLLVVLLVIVGIRTGAANEPSIPVPPVAEDDACVNELPDTGLKMLQKIPYISRLFRNTTSDESKLKGMPVCQASSCEEIIRRPLTQCVAQIEPNCGNDGCESCAAIKRESIAGRCQPLAAAKCGPIVPQMYVAWVDGFERIGIDFDYAATPEAKANAKNARCAECSAGCVSNGSPSGQQCSQQCSQQACQHTCQPNSQPTNKAVAVTQTQPTPVTCAVCTQLTSRASPSERLIPVSAVEAALRGRDEFFDECIEFTRRNAELEAKLEMVESTQALREQLIESQREIARLQTKLELAAAREELQKQFFKIAVENESLKQRIASLEKEREQRSNAGSYGATLPTYAPQTQPIPAITTER